MINNKNDQFDTCIFAKNKDNHKWCGSIKELICNERKCPFYKSKEEWEFDPHGCGVRKKEVV